MRSTVLGGGLLAVVFAALVQAPAYASLGQPARGLPLRVPGISLDETVPQASGETVVVADPRHRGLLVEVPARDAGRLSVDALYRNLVRARARGSANSVTVTNGRVFFVRSETSAVASGVRSLLPELSSALSGSGSPGSR